MLVSVNFLLRFDSLVNADDFERSGNDFFNNLMTEGNMKINFYMKINFRYCFESADDEAPTP